MKLTSLEEVEAGGDAGIVASEREATLGVRLVVVLFGVAHLGSIRDATANNTTVVEASVAEVSARVLCNH